jgi:sialate O-acetylesterase
MKRVPLIAILLILVSSMINPVKADVKMPRIFSNNMVLQREAPVKVWGQADAGERIRVNIQDQTKTVRADRNGNWSVTLSPLKVGGPYELSIRGKNTITFRNILVGDVWLGSGQSNMEWPVMRSANAEQEAAAADYPQIRLFTVPRKMSSKPLSDIEAGEWLVCSPENIPNFSAVAYYFGRHIHQETGIPIGLINSSWGGTVAETWISKEAISTHADFRDLVSGNNAIDTDKLAQEAASKLAKWSSQLENDDMGNKNNWANASLDDSAWDKMPLPGLWEQSTLPDLDGVVWFRKEISLSSKQASQNLVLNLGPIDDSDYTYVNGQLVGKTLDRYSDIRRYEVPASVLMEGKNMIAVRVIDTGGGGGLWAEDNQFYYTSGSERFSLTGDWKYNIGVISSPPPQAASGPNMFPSLLYNGMIHPIQQFALRGTIWYQGESNAGRAFQYRTLFPLLINDWRQQFNNPQMPFLFVQLANFMMPDKKPTDSDWARLREAQTMTLQLPNTGMALAIDIGEANDIHPLNKQDVGKRLALAALNISYGKDVVSSGPMYQSMQVDGSIIRLTLNDGGSPMVAQDKYGYLRGFAIAGEDKVFYWAKARFDGTQVLVYHPDVKNPVAVRYAWGNNPDDANLYNAAGLPAVPFRTDDW